MRLSALSDELTQVRTKKREFLAEIDRIVPWGEWISLIRPCYYKGERGNKPYDLERMLRIYTKLSLTKILLRADEVLSHTGKYPKGAGGGQRVHVSWPPPDPPLLRNSAPLASQGRAQLGSHPSLGGPLSPSAQLIPPPAFGRRFIPGVSARNHYGTNTLLQYVPQLRCHAQCVPTPAPDWLLAHGQTKWRARCGSCRSRSRVKHPSAAKKARRLSHLRAYFYSTYCHFST